MKGIDGSKTLRSNGIGHEIVWSKFELALTSTWHDDVNKSINRLNELKQVVQSSDNRCILANCPRTRLWIVFQMAYFLIPDAILFEFGPFLGNSTRVWRTDRRTNGRTDGRTDTPTHRDARTHLKSEISDNTLVDDEVVAYHVPPRFLFFISTKMWVP